LYYNRVSMVTKDLILGKAWEAQLAMFAAGKKCWVRSVKKMATQESVPGGGKFSASGSIVARNSASSCSDSCAPSEDYSIAAGNGSWDNAHTSDPFSRGERPNKKPNALVEHTQRTGGSLDG
jgi:hypothetical protein